MFGPDEEEMRCKSNGHPPLPPLNRKMTSIAMRICKPFGKKNLIARMKIRWLNQVNLTIYKHMVTNINV